eukprot:scaffold51834_cov67-Attheya_sp.AAC.4
MVTGRINIKMVHFLFGQLLTAVDCPTYLGQNPTVDTEDDVMVLVVMDTTTSGEWLTLDPLWKIIEWGRKHPAYEQQNAEHVTLWTVSRAMWIMILTCSLLILKVWAILFHPQFVYTGSHWFTHCFTFIFSNRRSKMTTHTNELLTNDYTDDNDNGTDDGITTKDYIDDADSNHDWITNDFIDDADGTADDRVPNDHYTDAIGGTDDGVTDNYIYDYGKDIGDHDGYGHGVDDGSEGK